MILRLDGDKSKAVRLGWYFAFWFLRNFLWVGMAMPGWRNLPSPPSGLRRSKLSHHFSRTMRRPAGPVTLLQPLKSSRWGTVVIPPVSFSGLLLLSSANLRRRRTCRVAPLDGEMHRAHSIKTFPLAGGLNKPFRPKISPPADCSLVPPVCIAHSSRSPAPRQCMHCCSFSEMLLTEPASAGIVIALLRSPLSCDGLLRSHRCVNDPALPPFTAVTTPCNVAASRRHRFGISVIAPNSFRPVLR